MASPAPNVRAAPHLTADELIPRMVAAANRQTQPFQQTYDAVASIESGVAVDSVAPHDRFIWLYVPPDKVDQSYVDLGRGGATTHTITIASSVFTDSPNGWVCARAQSAYHVQGGVVIRRLLDQMGTAAHVSGPHACGTSTCYDLSLGRTDDPPDAIPSTVNVNVTADATTDLLLHYTLVRTYANGKKLEETAVFTYGLPDRITAPIPRCDIASG